MFTVDSIVRKGEWLMATLEQIQYIPHRTHVAEDYTVRREVDCALRPIKGLPQIFWADGSSWRAVNLWAVSRATDGMTDIKTVRSNLGHLHKYAQWLEDEQLDWQHFPMLERERVLIRWRKHLIEQRDRLGMLAPSTVSQRMNAVIHFYRFAQAHGILGREVVMWRERQVFHKYFDTEGFERTMLRQSTNLSIPNRITHGLKLEGGITPLTFEQMKQLLAFTGRPGNVSRELDLMLKLGFFTGARLETISDLKRGTLINAIPAPEASGLFILAVGPGHRPYVATKFNVSGRIFVPSALLEDLRAYLTDVSRLKREALAAPEDKELVFLTRYGRRYVDRNSGSGNAVGRAMVDLRRRATAAGLELARHFHFHMTRATFGTSLTSLLLSQAGSNEKEVLELVSTLMLHKNVSTTLKYIKFAKQSGMKAKVANEFSDAYLGLRSRLGDNRA
jgi:integrase